MKYVQALRIKKAKQMLGITAQPTDNVVTAARYADVAFLAACSSGRMGVTLVRCRQRFRTLEAANAIGKAPSEATAAIRPLRSQDRRRLGT
ncbi:hypothetical protein [Rubellimicrobium roseum]|uniref:Uncharacterized protein n=1 Tax=Rubellimicrobium roseum TaxID=687525 RepID=A0A5C4N8X2_9RHOB|nr:hypothetical protein [Rubellimicrobium roseum]TNC71304.1 hypothetical protein FHG71_11960 [Rubellimicrobium roseum]